MTRDVLCEQRVFSRRHRFAGTLDVLGLWEGAGALIDYKTGNPRDVAADLQTAAYYGALMEMRANGDTADQVIFDPVPHTYTVNGERYPSVTQIIQRAGLIDFSKIPNPILIAARDRGSAVHAALHYYNEGDLDAGFQYQYPEYWPYVAAWLHFLDSSGFIFAGRADLETLTHIRRFSIRLRKDERYTIEAYTRGADYAEFLALRQAQAIVDRRRPGAHFELAEVA